MLSTASRPDEGTGRRQWSRVGVDGRHYYGGEPDWTRIGFGGDPGTPTPIEIVGVVKDSKYTGVRDETPRQVFFYGLMTYTVSRRTREIGLRRRPRLRPPC